ncbi:branched-chain amino acid transport family protein [Clostridioides difficile CD160]|nr:branched-chain amino acid transport family protein [Clostridioides difficile CD160]MBY2478631.1 AzlD domain-containing protein [Clostridioides difficile]
MNNNYYILCIIIGMYIVTYLPRVLPMLIFSKKEMPEFLKKIMKFIPVAILTSLTAKDVFFNGDNLYLSISNPKIISFLVVLLVAYKFKSIGISIVTGVISIYLFGIIL